MIPKINRHDEIIRTLTTIQSAGFDAVIAGGAVRDLYFEGFPRDVDIFVQDPEYMTNTKIPFATKKVRSSKYWYDLLECRQSTYIGGDKVDHNFKNYNLLKKVGKITLTLDVIKNFIPYNIIFTKRPVREHIEKYFNLGICKCYCDGYKFRFLPDFMNDANKRTFTIVGQEMIQDEYDYTVNVHIPRIADKFPGFKTVVAPHNQHLVAKP